MKAVGIVLIAIGAALASYLAALFLIEKTGGRNGHKKDGCDFI
jgi:hypothetical protein